MGKIKKSDVIDSSVKTEFEALGKSVKSLIADLKTLIITTSKSREVLKSEKTTLVSLNVAKNNLNNTVKQTEKVKQKEQSITERTIKTQKAYFQSLQSLEKQKQKQAAADKKATAQQEKLKKTINATEGSINKLRYANKKLLDVRNNLNKNTKEGAKQFTLINKKIDENTKKIQSEQTVTEKRTTGIGKYKEALQSVPGPLGQMGNAMKIIATNPMILAITLLIGSFKLLFNSLGKSEEGQNKLNVIMETGGAIIGKLMDYVGKFAIGIIDAFTSPKKAISNLWEFIQSQLLNRINAAKKFISAFGDVLSAVWERDMDKIKESGKNMGSAYIDMLTGVEDTLGKVSEAQNEFTEEITKSAQAGIKAAKLEAHLNKIKRNYMIADAKVQGKISTLRAKAEEIKEENAKQGLVYLKEAQALEMGILAHRKEEMRVAFELQKARSAQGKDDIEAKKALAQAEVDYINSQTAYSQKREKDAKKLNIFKLKAITQENKANKEKNKETKKGDDEEITSKEDQIKLIEDKISGTQKEMKAVKVMFANNEITAEQYSDRMIELSDNELDRQIKALESLLEFEELTDDQRMELAIKLSDAKIALEEKEREEIEKTAEQRKESALKALDQTQEMIGQTFDLFKGYNDAKLQSIENSQQAELLAAGDNELAKQKINEKYDKERAKIQTRQAKADKAKALFDIGIAMAVGLVEAFPNPYLMGLIGTLGIANLAIVASKPIPKFAKGVKGFSGGVAELGEEDSELVRTKDGMFLADHGFYNLPKGADVFTASETKSILSNNTILSDKKISNNKNEQEILLKALISEVRNKEDVKINVDRQGLSVLRGVNNRYEIRREELIS